VTIARSISDKHIINVVSSDTCDENREKRDDVRSISSMNTMSLDWFRPSRGITAIRPVFAVKAPDEL
jgi:hypothetical protein